MKISKNYSKPKGLLYSDLKEGDVYELDNGTENRVTNQFLKIEPRKSKLKNDSFSVVNAIDLINNTLTYHFPLTNVIKLKAELKIYGEDYED